MPYLPTNYYPKNCAIATKGVPIKDSEGKIIDYQELSDPVALQCMVDSYDTIDRAIIRIYECLTNKLVYIIYLDKMNGKVIKKEPSEDYPELGISDEDYIKWCNGESIIDFNSKIDFTNDENTFPIQGGKGDASIIYILLDDLVDLKIKKYTWVIEVFSADKNVWIVDGELDNAFESNIIKIYPNNNIQTNNLFHTEEGDYTINSVVNKYWEYETTCSAKKAEEITINDKKFYKHSITFKEAISLPDNKDDIKVQIDVYTYDLIISDTDIEYNGDADGYIKIGTADTSIINTVVYSKVVLTEVDTTKSYVLFYRDKQTLILNGLPEGGFTSGLSYTIYSNSIRSTPNYFIGISEPEIETFFVNWQTNGLKHEVAGNGASFEKIEANSDLNMKMKNSFQQFWTKIYSPIKWYQWTIYDSVGSQVYQTEQIYSSNIYLEYGEFFNKTYEIHLKIQYQNNYIQEKSYIINIEHESMSDSELLPKVDFHKRAIKVDYTDIKFFTPIIDKTIKYTTEGVEIAEGGSLTYSTEDSVLKDLNPAVDWTFKGKFGQDFYGNIFSIKIDDANYILKFNGEDDYFFWGISHAETLSKIGSWSNGDKAELFITNSPNITYRTVVGDIDDTQDIVGFYYNDFLKDKDFTIRYDKNTLILGIGEESYSEENGYAYSNGIFNLATNFTFSQEDSLSTIQLFGNIIWKSLQIDSEGTGSPQLAVDFLRSINGGDYLPPLGFALDKYRIYRTNIQNNKEISDFQYITSVSIKNEELKIFGIYDYGIGGDNKYGYFLIPIYRKNKKGAEFGADIYIAGPIVKSSEVTTDWFGVGLFGTKENKDNKYLMNTNQKWYFDLDVDANNLTFNTDSQIFNTNSAIPKIGKSNKNYLSNSIKTKLGNIQNEYEYINDNIKYLHKFLHFANDNTVKILRLHNGLIIPVGIQLKSSTTQNNLIGTPTDISFDWTQVAKYEDASLYEYLYKESDN